MLSLFRNKKRQKTVFENTAQDRIAKNVVGKLLRLQQRWAAFMERHTERLSIKWKLILLFFFCLCSGGLSILFIARILINNHSVSFHVTQGKIPQHIGKSGDEKTKAITIITKEEYGEIQQFKKYMDSLARTPSAKKHYDSILINRPSLMDSVILIENIYKSQNKKQ
jgi:hypothetical protein